MLALYLVLQMTDAEADSTLFHPSLPSALKSLRRWVYRSQTRGCSVNVASRMAQNQPTRQIYATIAELIRRHGARAEREHFLHVAAYRQALREAPVVAASLLGQFERPQAEETVVILERLPCDAPIQDLRKGGTIVTPTLVLANRQDSVHPFAYGKRLAQAIDGALFEEITPKVVSRDRHAADVQGSASRFLLECGP